MKLFSVLFVLTCASAAQAEITYPLTCRGGGGANGAGGTLGLSTIDNSAVLYFAKAGGPAGSGLAPGQCAWQDRAISETGEPPCLKQYNPGAVAWIFAADSKRSQSYLSSTTGSHWMRDLLDSGKYVTFQAYNPGNGGCFVVTRLGF